eukprot:356842-Chlamydomonas_euryale.AAC.2
MLCWVAAGRLNALLGGCWLAECFAGWLLAVGRWGEAGGHLGGQERPVRTLRLACLASRAAASRAAAARRASSASCSLASCSLSTRRYACATAGERNRQCRGGGGGRVGLDAGSRCSISTQKYVCATAGRGQKPTRGQVGVEVSAGVRCNGKRGKLPQGGGDEQPPHLIPACSAPARGSLGACSSASSSHMSASCSRRPPKPLQPHNPSPTPACSAPARGSLSACSSASSSHMSASCSRRPPKPLHPHNPSPTPACSAPAGSLGACSSANSSHMSASCSRRAAASTNAGSVFETLSGLSAMSCPRILSAS